MRDVHAQSRIGAGTSDVIGVPRKRDAVSVPSEGGAMRDDGAIGVV